MRDSFAHFRRRSRVWEHLRRRRAGSVVDVDVTRVMDVPYNLEPRRARPRTPVGGVVAVNIYLGGPLLHQLNSLHMANPT